MVQPDSPAELGGKIYEMMAIALGGRWGRLDEGEPDSESKSEASFEDSEAEVVEPSEVQAESEVVEPSEVRTESDPWKD